MIFAVKIGLAIVLDQLVGDPQWFPHPVRYIGRFCLWCEERFCAVFRNRKTAGVCTVGAVLATTILCVGMILETTQTISPILSDMIAILILWTSIAARDLVIHSRKVYNCLLANDIVEAREAVSKIVGRDTEGLGRDGISRACVETVAENMVDGVTSPLFYAVLCAMFAPAAEFNAIGFAAFGAMVYKAINTMDSMFGYKNEKYLEFGWAAARLDDIANFIPARISGLMVVLSAFVLNLDWRGAARIFFRDRLQHSSPNSAHAESAVAGALGIQLGGDVSYFGRMTKKPTIGDQTRDISENDILLTEKLMQVGALFFVILLLVVKYVLLEI